MSEPSISKQELLGLFIWLMFQRHDGIVQFKNDEIAKYPGMAKLQIAMEVTDDGITIFVVEPDSQPTPTSGLLDA
jgi:hypothetical protein